MHIVVGMHVEPFAANVIQLMWSS